MTKNNLKVVKTTKNQDLENKEKNKALDAAISQITENFGKGSVMKLGQQTAMDIESISTGSLSLDLALGIGGLPKGRVIEIYGPESSGKTTLALQVVAEAQKTGGICGFIDAEHALDPVYAKKLGVDTEELLISQPDTGEQALEIADTLIKSGSVSVLVIDSVAASKALSFSFFSKSWSFVDLTTFRLFLVMFYLFFIIISVRIMYLNVHILFSLSIQ